jgi:hypothetical protein
MGRTEQRVRFSLGETVITQSAQGVLNMEDVACSLQRHLVGDWGNVSKADGRENEISLREGFRLLSVYKDRNGAVFWIITEADRTATTVLLPSDY